MTRRQTLAVVLTAFLGVSVLAGAGLATGSQQATGIAECTTITESGTYELTQDITYQDEEGGCIRIAADDVTLDGNGHTIRYEQVDPHNVLGAGIQVQNASNVVVKNVTLGVEAQLRIEDATDVTVRDSTSTYGVDVYDSQDVTLTQNEIGGNGLAIVETQGVQLTGNQIAADATLDTGSGVENATVSDNSGDGTIDLLVQGGDAVVHGNSVTALTVVGYQGTDVTVARNDITGGDLHVRSNTAAWVENNTVTNGQAKIGGSADTFVFAHNTVTGSEFTGLSIHGDYEEGPSATVHHNVITGHNNAIESHTDLATIHQNDLSGNANYGVEYTRDYGVVNATSNYWGDRPSSVDDPDAPFEDPQTGALANGSGTAVSEGSAPAGAEPGVSNVHFDPWLDTAPSDAGVVEQTDDGSDSGDGDSTTTPTTTDEPTTTTTDEPTTTTTDEPTTTTTTTTEDGSDGSDGTVDDDCDGLTNAEEQELGTDPHSYDTDGDGVGDGDDEEPLDASVA